MTTDTEARLRAALHAGAELITVEPAQLPQLPRDRRRHRLVWPLAAAAVVVAVAALAVVVQHHPSSTPPAHQPSVSGSVTPPVVDGLHPAACAATNGSSWHTTLVTAPDAPRYDITGELWLLGVDGHGNAVLIEQTRPNRVLLVVPEGTPTPIRDLYTAPTTVAGQGQARIGGGMVDGEWVVFSIITGGGQGGLSGIDAVNTATGALRDIRDVSLGNALVVSEPIIVDGVVYWSEVSNVGFGHIYAYDLATGTRRTLETGPDADPFTVAGGVYWVGPGPKQVVTYRPGTLPPGYVVTVSSSPSSVLVAGDLLAWNQGAQILARRGSGSAVPVATGAAVAITNDYLVYTRGAHTMFVLDLRTGATMALPEPGPFGMPAFGGTGTLALNTLGSHGGSNLTLAHVATLPRLHC